MIPRRPVPVLKPNRHQGGMVLLLCLIFLTAMMLVGLSASADTILQSQLSANLRETERVRQAAHAAMTWAEKWIFELDLPYPENCNTTCNLEYLQTTGSLPARPEQEPLAWWREKGFETGLEPQNADTPTTPGNIGGDQSLWLIEPVHQVAAAEDGSSGRRAWFRVLSRGSGDSGKLVSVMESIVVRTWPTTEQTASTGIDSAGWCATHNDACGRLTWRELR